MINLDLFQMSSLVLSRAGVIAGSLSEKCALGVPWIQSQGAAEANGRHLHMRIYRELKTSAALR